MHSVGSEIVEHAEIHGRLRLTVLDEHDDVVDQRDGYNVICTTGFTVLTAALVWAGIEDQAANLGVTSATYLTPLYGAVGDGTGTPTKSDTTLFTELSRTTVGGGGSTPASSTIAAMCSWDFFFPNPSVDWTLTEAGVFAGATSVSGSGSMIDHWAFSPTITVLTTNTFILQVSLEMGP